MTRKVESNTWTQRYTDIHIQGSWRGDEEGEEEGTMRARKAHRHRHRAVA